MTRISPPRAGEPIRLNYTASGEARYHVTLDVAQPGMRRRQIKRSFRTLRAARDFVTATRAGLASGTYTPPSAETVRQLVRRWLDSRRDIRPVTVEGYSTQLAPVLRHLGDRKVQSLTVADVESLIAWMGTEGGARGQALGARSIRAALVALSQALDLAAREGTVNRNVARLARRPRTRKVAGTDLSHWQPDQLQAFVRHADSDPLAGAWRLTACGLTRADVLGLRWSDIDMAEGVVRISQGRVALERSDHVDDPKSASRRRAVPVEAMWPGTLSLLRALSAQQAADRLRAGPAWADSGFVVVDALGQGVRPEWYSDRFRTVSREAGLPSITLHSVRHSLAFWLHSLGVTPADAAALLGHTVEVHLSTYLPHSGASGIASAAQALGRVAAAE
jgi:integrase